MALSLAISSALNSAVLGGAVGPPKPSVTVTGATTTTSGAYTIQSWTSSGSIAIAGAALDVEYLVVAGGGGGGGSDIANNEGGGGGGAGGLRTNVGGTALSLSAATHAITVGAGGAGGVAGAGFSRGTSGNASSIAALVTTVGGGGGGGAKAGQSAATGGSGGGGAGFMQVTAASGTSGQGNAGGNGQSGANYGAGGGGGANAVGAVGTTTGGGNGGNGVANAITGSSLTYAGGGGGGIRLAGTSAGTGGTGGGGNGGRSVAATAGTDGFGGGGGGAAGFQGPSGTGGDGGDGVVIIRYLTASVAPFSPLDLSPALWLDASDATTITASSGAVSQWRDKSGNARHVSQATAANQPTTGVATLNGRNVLSFDGGDTLTSSVWSLAQPMTVVTVFRTGASQAVYAFIFDGHNANAGVRAVQVVRNQDFSNQSVVYAGADVVTGVLSSNTAFAWATVFNGASSVSRRDGTTTNLATSPGTAGITSGVAISGTGTNSRFTGTVAEVIIVGSALTAQQLTDLSTYITNKWGVTL